MSADPRVDPNANDGHAKCRDETRLARDLAGHRIRDIHDCFLMNCRDLGDEVRGLYERLAVPVEADAGLRAAIERDVLPWLDADRGVTRDDVVKRLRKVLAWTALSAPSGSIDAERLTRDERRNLAALERRADHLEGRAKDEGYSALSWDLAEAKALRWAIARLSDEAAG